MAIFDFTDYKKKKDEDELTPSQKAREEVKLSSEKKKTDGQVFDFSDFETIKAKRQADQQPVAQPKPEEKKGFLQKAGETIGKVVEVGKKVFSKQTFDTIKSSLSEQMAKEEAQARSHFGDDGLSSLQEINDYGTVPFLQTQKQENETRLSELLAKPEKSKTDEYRIKNINDKIAEFDRLINGTPEDRAKANLFIQQEAAWGD